ncbi:isochorismatase family protein [Lichenicoccus sp.]|uniref:isochorismatase family protein n=1 Tax=Lichenicoccus sp. TaxID=2781899 RepID=UPI003D0F733A
MLDLDPKATALVVIDLQQGTLLPEPVPFGSDAIVGRAAALGRAFADAGAPIALTVTDFAPGYADAPRGRADAPWALPLEGLPPGFATLVPEIEALPAAVRITKRQMSAFFGAELDLQLRRRGCRAVVICGVATNMGVEATARAAFDLNYDVVIAADACGSVAPGLHAFAVDNILPRIARVRDAAAVIKAIRRRA